MTRDGGIFSAVISYFLAQQRWLTIDQLPSWSHGRGHIDDLTLVWVSRDRCSLKVDDLCFNALTNRCASLTCYPLDNQIDATTTKSKPLNQLQET